MRLTQKGSDSGYARDIRRVLKYLIKEFKKINGKNFEIYYVKVALPVKSSESDREKTWSVLWGDDENKRYPEYTQYGLFEREDDIEPSHIVYGALNGMNVTEGWIAIDDTIEKTVKRLLLRRYEPESMPDSDTFLDNFSKFANTKVPIQRLGGNVYYWYEFLLKLSREQGAFIDGDLCLRNLHMSALPCATKIQGLQTDVLTASIYALKHLLDRAEQKHQQAEADLERAKGNDSPAKKPTKTKVKKRRKRKTKLTNKQKDIYDRMARGATVNSLAAEEDCSASNIRQQYKKAKEKIEKLHAGSRSTNFQKIQRLPTDKRGQEAVEDDKE